MSNTVEQLKNQFEAFLAEDSNSQVATVQPELAAAKL